MAMGRKAKQRRQEAIWIAHTDLPRTLAHPFYEQLNRLLEERGFDEWVERQCTRFYAERMGQAESGAGAVLPYAAHRVFRRHRRRAWDRKAGGGLAGAAQFSGSGTERDAARALDDLAHPTADRRGNSSGGVPRGAAVAGREGLVEGENVGVNATTLEALKHQKNHRA